MPVVQFNTNDHELMQSLANQLYEFSDAFLALQAETKNHDLEQQPLIIFTDASVQRKKKHAAFAIVIKNIPFSFDLPMDILKKYNIRIDPESSDELCILTGEILNQNVDVAEIMAIIASVDIFCYLTRISKQKLVIYTDSLNAKKILGNKRMPPRSKTYSLLRKNFLDIINFPKEGINVDHNVVKPIYNNIDNIKQNLQQYSPHLIPLQFD